MSLEEDINTSNKYYLSQNLCLIYKRPTPINVVRVDYTHNRITDAYFEKQSTTDYNGIYRGHYIDIEAKCCQSKISFPLHNIHQHQLNHLNNVLQHGGYAFFIIRLSAFEEDYLLYADAILSFIKDNNRKSIPVKTIKKKGILIAHPSLLLPIDYLEAIKTFFKNEEST